MSIKKGNLHDDLVNFIRRQHGLHGFWEAGASGYKGKVYYVARAGGSDNFDGESPETPYRTFAQAVTAAAANVNWSATPWARHDVIYMYPGNYDEDIIAVPHGCAVIGVGGVSDAKDGQISAVLDSADVDTIDVASIINAQFINIGFQCGTASKDCIDADILNNVLFANCYFSGPVETSTGRGITTKDSTRLIVDNCEFTCLDKGINVDYADANDKFAHAQIKNSIFSQIDTAGIELSASLVGPSSTCKWCTFTGSGVTMAAAVADSAGILDVMWCVAEATAGFTCRSVNASYLNGSIQT